MQTLKHTIDHQQPTGDIKIDLDARTCSRRNARNNRGKADRKIEATAVVVPEVDKHGHAGTYGTAQAARGRSWLCTANIILVLGLPFAWHVAGGT